MNSCFFLKQCEHCGVSANGGRRGFKKPMLGGKRAARFEMGHVFLLEAA